MLKISKIFISDLLSNWTLIIYTIFIVFSTIGLFMIDDHSDKSILGVLNLSLLVIPLFTIIFSTVYYYKSYDFITFLLSQPLRRGTIIVSLYLSLAFVFSLILILGMGVPLIYYYPDERSYMLIVTSLFLSIIFVALALLSSILSRDKAKGIGLALIFWVYFVLLFDGIVLLLMYNFSEYPIEKFVLFISFLNPVDLARIMVLMKTETAALLGYSGAVFEDFFTSSNGLYYGLSILFAWALIPLMISRYLFLKKNF